jgi:hypothetical protein
VIKPILHPNFNLSLLSSILLSSLLQTLWFTIISLAHYF